MSIRALAAGVGKSHTAVRRWIEHPEWNQPRRPPWDVEKARAWAARTLSPDPARTWEQLPSADGGGGDGLDVLRRNPLQAARLKLTVVRAQKLELERGILAGEYVLRRDVERALVARVHAARAAFQALPRQVAGQLVGLTSEVEIERVIEDAIAGILFELSQQLALPRLSEEATA